MVFSLNMLLVNWNYIHVHIYTNAYSFSVDISAVTVIFMSVWIMCYNQYSHWLLQMPNKNSNLIYIYICSFSFQNQPTVNNNFNLWVCLIFILNSVLYHCAKNLIDQCNNVFFFLNVNLMQGIQRSYKSLLFKITTLISQYFFYCIIMDVIIHKNKHLDETRN